MKDLYILFDIKNNDYHISKDRWYLNKIIKKYSLLPSDYIITQFSPAMLYRLSSHCW